MVVTRNNKASIKPKGRVAPPNLGTAYLLSAGYDGDSQKAYVRLYEPESKQIYLWYDNTDHLPYLITKETPAEVRSNNRVVNHEGFLTCETLTKFDALNDEEIRVTLGAAFDLKAERAVKDHRRISDRVYRHLIGDTHRAATS